MKLSDMIVESFIQKFTDSDNFCGFTLPFIFSNGSPAVIHAHKEPNGNILLSDYGQNISFLYDSIGKTNFDAVEKAKEFIQPYEKICVKNRAINASTTPDDLDFTMLDYLEVVKKMVEYHPKVKNNKIDDILESIRAVLEKKYQHVDINPGAIGRSGGKYNFNFGHDNLMIDFTIASKEKTNYLLRKFIDTKNLNHELEFSVIIDDLENDRYKSEQNILSEYAIVQKLSAYIAA